MRRLITTLFGLVILLLALFAVLTLVVSSAGEVDPSECRPGNILAGVHDPERLKVLDTCVTAQGTVAVVENHADGDWHIGLIPELDDLDLLARANVTKLAGLLVVEVIPQDQDAVVRPRIGSRISVTGAYVLDTDYGWREIHPAWSVREIAPSPLPPGTEQTTRNLAAAARRLLLRMRAEVRARL